jgi:hypothetical protein
MEKDFIPRQTKQFLGAQSSNDCYPGTDVMIFKKNSQKKIAKKMAF